METTDINEYHMRAVLEAASFCESTSSGTFLCSHVGVVITSAQIKPEYQVDMLIKIEKASLGPRSYRRPYMVYSIWVHV